MKRPQGLGVGGERTGARLNLCAMRLTIFFFGGWLSRFKLIRLRPISLATLSRYGWIDGMGGFTEWVDGGMGGFKSWFHYYKRYVQ
jgi:hypothetical protein